MSHPLFGRRLPAAGHCPRLAAIVLAVASLLAPAAPAAAEDEATIQRTAELINNIRARLDACGDEGMLAVSTTATPVARETQGPRIAARPRLQWNPLLAKTAQRHSESMATEGYFDHVDTQGRTVGARARAAGYRYRVVGENLAAGYASIEEAIGGWLLSTSHCRNLIDPRFTEFGIAQVRSRDANDRYGAYWTLVLGMPQGSQVAKAH